MAFIVDAADVVIFRNIFRKISFRNVHLIRKFFLQKQFATYKFLNSAFRIPHNTPSETGDLSS